MRTEKILYTMLTLLSFWQMPVLSLAESSPLKLKVDYSKQIRTASSDSRSKVDTDNDFEFSRDWRQNIVGIWSDTKYRSRVRYVKSIVTLANDGVPNKVEIVGAFDSDVITLATDVLSQSRAKRCAQPFVGGGRRYLISFLDYPEVRVERYAKLSGM